MAMNTTTRMIAPEALGLQTWELLQREVTELIRVLSLDEPVWSVRTAFAELTVAQLVEHLAEDALHQAQSWEQHFANPEAPVFVAREDPGLAPTLAREPSSGSESLNAYREAVERLHRSLSQARQGD